MDACRFHVFSQMFLHQLVYKYSPLFSFQEQSFADYKLKPASL